MMSINMFFESFKNERYIHQTAFLQHPPILHLYYWKGCSGRLVVVWTSSRRHLKLKAATQCPNNIAAGISDILSWMEIHQLIMLGEKHETVQHFKYMSKKFIFPLSWRSRGRVQQLSKNHRFKSTSYFQESLCLIITSPSPSTSIK